VSPTNVVPDPREVLTDIASCHLQSVSWVIPNGKYSDHASIDTDLGPQWVAAIVNSIGASHCQDSGKTYWQDTAIIITWDDWGGWYDHEAPQLNTTQVTSLASASRCSSSPPMASTAQMAIV
jgi:phospholipase C